MVRSVQETPAWASHLDRGAYLALLAGVQRWLAVHGPGILRGDEIRTVSPRRAIPIAPLAERITAFHDPLVIDAELAAYIDEATAGAPAQAASIGSVHTPASVLERLSLRIAPEDEVVDQVVGAVGLPGLIAILTIDGDDGTRDVTTLEIRGWPERPDELIDRAAKNLQDRDAESVRVLDLEGIGSVVAIEGSRITNAAHVLWVERFAGDSPLGWFVGLPDAYLVFAMARTEITSASAVEGMRRLVEEQYESGSTKISPRLFFFAHDHIEEAPSLPPEPPVAGRASRPEPSANEVADDLPPPIVFEAALESASLTFEADASVDPVIDLEAEELELVAESGAESPTEAGIDDSETSLV